VLGASFKVLAAQVIGFDKSQNNSDQHPFSALSKYDQWAGFDVACTLYGGTV